MFGSMKCVRGPYYQIILIIIPVIILYLSGQPCIAVCIALDFYAAYFIREHHDSIRSRFAGHLLFKEPDLCQDVERSTFEAA